MADTELKQAEKLLRDNAASLRTDFDAVMDGIKISEHKQLQILSAKLQAIVQSSDDAIISKTLEGIVTSWNKSAQTIFGYSAEEMIGQSILKIFPPDRTDEERMILDKIGRGERMTHFETVRLRKDGTLVDISVTMSPIFDDMGNIIGVSKIARDVTERKQIAAYEQFRSNILERITGNSSLSILLEAIVCGIEKLNPAMLCSILLLDSEGKHLGRVIAPSLPDFYNAAIDGIEIGLGVGSCGTAAFTGATVIVTDISTHPYWAAYKDLAARADLRSCWSQPILSSTNQVLGTFAIYHHEAHAPTATDNYLIKQCSHLASIAIERHLVEEQLHIASTAFETQEGMLITDANMVVLRSNHAFTSITGYSAEELLSTTPAILRPEHQEPEIYKSIWDAVSQDKFWSGEIWDKRKNGEVFPAWMTLTAVTTLDGSTTHYVVTFSDVSEHKRAEIAILESENRFRTIFEQADIGLAITNADTGQFLQVNQKCCQIVDYTLDELLSLNFKDITHPDDLPLQEEMTAGLRAKKYPEYTLVRRWIRKDQSIIWVSVSCSVFWKIEEQTPYHISVVQDITQSKHIEEELEHHRNHLQELVDEKTLKLQISEASTKSALDALENRQFALDQHAIVSITNAQGRITYTNDKFCSISGYSREELLGQDHAIINSGYHPHGFFKDMYRIVAKGQVWHNEVCNRGKDGQLYWVDSTVVPFMGENGKPKEYVAIRTDITERKRVEKLAEDANRSKSEFLANMSHEIRTPMNGVVGMVDILKQTALSREQHRMVRTIRDSALSLLAILNDILDFSKIEAGKLTVEAIPTNVQEVAEAVAQLIIPTTVAKNIDFHIFISPETPAWIVSDPIRLRQILFNLIGNAVKFTATGADRLGQVTLRIDTVTLSSGCNGLRMCVKDNGIGMSPETVASLFKPFTQGDESTTRRFGGTGLGLSITKRLVEILHGQILVHSNMGEGSEFTVELPVQASSPGHSLVIEIDLTGVRVVVVTVNPIYKEILTAYLSVANAEVKIVADMATAYQLSSQWPGAVLILDPKLAKLKTTLAKVNMANSPRVVRLSNRNSSSSSNDKEVTVSVSPLLYHELVYGVAIAARKLTTKDVTHERRQLPRVTAPTVEEARTSGNLILLAEDNEINREVIQEQLQILGYASEVAMDGLDALKRWRSKDYALLLTDCHMPKMDGFQLTAAIRAEESEGVHRPIIAVTANAMQGEAERCIENGMDDHLSKPLRLDELGPMLAKWLPHPKQQENESTLPLPSTPINELPVWDTTTLSLMIGGSHETHRHLLEKFLVWAEGMVVEIGAAVTADTPAMAADIAHKLKSSARSVGAMQLGELCQQLETAGRAGDMQVILAIVQNLNLNFQKVADLIKKG